MRISPAPATGSIAAAQSNPGILNLDSDYKETKPQLRIDVDTARAGDLGVSVAGRQSNALQSLLGSRRVSTYVDRGEEYRVDRPGRGRAPARPRRISPPSTCAAAPARWSRSPTWSRSRETAGARDLGRYNKLRAITLSGGLAPGYSLGEALTFLEQAGGAGARSRRRSAIAARASPSRRPADRSGSSSLLTILLVYLLLAAQFESFVHPGRDHHHRAAGGRRAE
jgi:multidrug efflux pump